MYTIDLTGKCAVVTGAGRGIGRGIAEILLEAGSSVIITDIKKPDLTDLREKFGNDKVTYYSMDVTSKSSIDQLVAKVDKLFGGIDILVNNAGISTMDFTVDIKEEDWDKVFNVNAKGTFLCSQAVARSMERRKKGGKIINIASQAGKNGYRCMASYCSSKHSVLGLTKVMALELAPNGILVNALCPGIVETEMKHREREIGGALRGMTAEEVREEDNSQVPLGRTSTIRDVAKTALFLSCDLSDYMTGQAVNVTGGMTMH